MKALWDGDGKEYAIDIIYETKKYMMLLNDGSKFRVDYDEVTLIISGKEKDLKIRHR